MRPLICSTEKALAMHSSGRWLQCMVTGGTGGWHVRGLLKPAPAPTQVPITLAVIRLLGWWEGKHFTWPWNHSFVNSKNCRLVLHSSPILFVWQRTLKSQSPEYELLYSVFYPAWGEGEVYCPASSSII